MKVLALDMAINTGWAYNREDGSVASGVLHFDVGAPKKPGETIQHPYMLDKAARELTDLMIESQAEVVMIEAGFHRGSGDKILQRLIGMGMSVAHRHGAAVLSVNAKTWRKAIHGSGGLTTDDAKALAKARTGVEDGDEAEARCILEYTLRSAIVTPAKKRGLAA